MPPKTKVTHKCEICQTVFNKKTELTKHLKLHKNNSSGSSIEMQQNEEQDIKQTFKRVFSGCLDIMRDEGITGEKSLDNIVSLITLKFLEPLIKEDSNFNINDYNEVIENELGEENLEHNKIILSKMLYFSNLLNEKEFGDDTKTITENELPNRMKYLWDIILSRYYLTNKIYLKNKGFDIKNKSTYSKIIEKLNLIKYQNDGFDLLGQAYEEVIKDIATKGKTLGQFFTQPIVKNICIDLVKPKLLPDGTIETICDPTMGTGGFLISSLKYILKQAEEKKISPDWNFITKEGFYGKEINYETYKLAFSNMLISSGKLFENLVHGDSIREPITKKSDIVLANPPYGIKGLEYDSFVIDSMLKNKYIPIKSKNAVSLFIQAIICMLKVNGRCAVVLPDGQDLFSKTDNAIVIREYLMKTCDLKEIVYLPSGSFDNTSIKTCIFYFEKRMEGIDVMETNIIYTKTNKEKSREYIFKPELQTTNIKFYNHTEEGKQLLIEVPIEKIVNNSYSLNYAEYIEKKEEQHNDGVVIKTLGELFKLNGNGKTNTSDITNSGEYPFYKASCENPSGTHNNYDFDGDEYLLIVKSGGSSKKPISENYGIGKVFLVKGKCSANIAVFQLLSKTENNIKFIHYYLLSIQSKIQMLAKYSTNNGNIDMNELMELKIPIPPLEKQTQLVEYLDFIYEGAIKTSENKIKELKKLNEDCLRIQRNFGENEVKTLGDVCNFKNGKGIKKDTLIEGEYPVIGGGQKPMGFHNEYNTNENVILCSSSGAYAGFISKYDKKVWASDCFSIIPKEDSSIDNKYLYYLLKTIQDKIYTTQSGAAQPHIYSKDLQNIKIPIPSLERQKEIVEYCEFNDTLISQLEKEIENNKKQAQKCLNMILK